MEFIEMKLPKELIELLGLDDGNSLESYSRLILTIELYKNEKVSMGKAAELAGMSYDDFYEAVKGRDILHVGPRNQDEAELEYKVAKRLIRVDNTRQ
jgi:predicted HTH domain antitoxin